MKILKNRLCPTPLCLTLPQSENLTRAHLKNSFIGILDAVCAETAEERGGIPRYSDEF